MYRPTLAGFRRAVFTAALLVLGATQAQAVTPAGAFFRSLVLPGWGQYAVGNTTRAFTFGGLEAGFWATAAGVSTLKSIYTDDYRSMASSIAGAAVEGKPRKYFDDLAFYETRTQHNQVAIIDESPDPELYGLADDWQWPTTADRFAYRSRFNDAKRMDVTFGYVMLAVTVNHLASAIDAGRTAGRMRDTGARAESGNGLHMSMVPAPEGARIVWWMRF